MIVVPVSDGVSIHIDSSVEHSDMAAMNTLIADKMFLIEEDNVKFRMLVTDGVTSMIASNDRDGLGALFDVIDWASLDSSVVVALVAAVLNSDGDRWLIAQRCAEAVASDDIERAEKATTKKTARRTKKGAR